VPAATAEGWLIGFAVAVPFGPISLICVQRSLERGAKCGIISGLGASTAHAVFAMLAGLWSGGIGSLLAEFQTPTRIVSAAVVMSFGLSIVCKRPAARSASSDGDLSGAYISTLVMALCNPMTVLPYLAMASTLSASLSGKASGLFLLPLLGVFAGAMSWYAALSCGTVLLRRSVSGVTARRLNLVAGGILIGLGGGMAIGWV
jgi:threonine/homoserine/homoserine lactone efflux protein